MVGVHSCMAKGRLLIHVESELLSTVRVVIVEEGGYRDVYTIAIKEGSGEMRIDGIAMGTLYVESSIDGEKTFYYPSNTLLFQDGNYIHKLNIIDRRKKSEKL